MRRSQSASGAGRAVDLIDEVQDADELRPWLIGKEIGKGATGVVYAATQRASGQRRAIKLMRPASEPDSGADAYVRREISNCASLRHPNVVRAYAGGRVRSGYFLVMELCEGGNLAAAVRRDGPLPAQAAVPLFLDVLSGLEYAHSLRVRAVTELGELDVTGLVHRDLKPANIFVADGSHAKVGDFGLAKAFDVAGISGLTRTGYAAGTPAFCRGSRCSTSSTPPRRLTSGPRRPRCISPCPGTARATSRPGGIRSGSCGIPMLFRWASVAPPFLRRSPASLTTPSWTRRTSCPIRRWPVSVTL